MKRLIFIINSFLLIAILLFSDCHKDENDLSSQNCTSRCTVVSGQILTNGGSAPLANVPIKLFWEWSVIEGGSITREKAITKTDNTGNFRIQFTMRDDEINSGGFYITVSVDTAQYLLYNQYGGDAFTILPRLKPDTLIFDNYLIPSKADLKVVLTNPSDVHSDQGDAINQQAFFSYANDDLWVFLNFGSSSPIPALQPVYVRTTKTKQGVSTNTYDTLFLQKNEHKVLNVTF